VRAFGWRSALQPAFVAASVAWAALLVLTPWVASRPRASDAAAALVLAVYGMGSLVCHQLPARSYRLWSAQMPVCARCAGIYFGAAIAAILAVAPLKRRPMSGAVDVYGAVVGRRFSGANASRTALIAAVVPTLATLVYEWTTGGVPAHWIRTAAGVPIGAVTAWLVVRETAFRSS
jgi:Predicted membrane protein (DUF2085)